MELAVIIPYYHGEKYIHRCIQSLEGFPKESIFIINNSVSNLEIDLEAQIVETGRVKIGFGAAVNYGFNYIKDQHYKYILILNQDAYFKEGHFIKLQQYLVEFNPSKFISPMIYTENFQEVMPFIKYRYFKNGIPDTMVELDEFVGVSLVLSADLMRALGGFDEQFFMYYEDIDLIKRSNINKPVRILPHVHVAHHNPDLYNNQSNPEKANWIDESRLLFELRYGNRLNWLFLFVKYHIKKLFKNL